MCGSDMHDFQPWPIKTSQKLASLYFSISHQADKESKDEMSLNPSCAGYSLLALLDPLSTLQYHVVLP